MEFRGEFSKTLTLAVPPFVMMTDDVQQLVDAGEVEQILKALK